MADYTILGALTGPGSNDGDPTQINLGMLFEATSTCWVKALRFWRSDTGVTGAPFGRLYTYTDESSGTAVTGTDATFTLSGTGWQQADLAAPVQLTAGTLYKVVVNFPSFYSGTGGFWATGAGVGGLVSGPLTAPDAGGAPLGIGGVKQDTFDAGSALAYPTSYFNGGNYWVDVLVTDTDPSNTPTTHIDTATGARAGAPGETLQVGSTTVDTATSATAGGPAGTLLIGLTHADTAGTTRAGGQPDALVVDLLHADTARGARTGGTPGVLVLDVVHVDTPRGARGGSPTGALTADLLHLDRPACARTAAPTSAHLIQADVTHADTPTGCRAAQTTDALHLGTYYAWPPRGASITVRRVATGQATVIRTATGAISIA